MSMIQPERTGLSHDGRVLLAGIVCIGVILGAGKGIPRGLHWYAETRRALASASDALTARSHAAMSRRSIEQSRDRAENTLLGLSPAFLKGTAPSQGAAELAALVADAGDANGVQISSLQPEADSLPAAMVVPVIVRVSGNGDMRGITGMLRDLESGTPLLEVRQLTISQADPGAPPERMETLHVELTVRGLYRHLPDETASSPER